MKWIAQQPLLDEMIQQIAAERVIAIDTEADSLHSYFDKVCLVQISARKDDYIIDPLARISLEPLGPVLADPNVTKIFHAADYDLRIMNRDFGFTVSNLFDTMISAQLLGMPQIGLAALLKKYFNLDADKSHQRADWSRRPLPPDMLHYAATDTHYLMELATILRRDLEAAGRWEWAAEEFVRLESIRFRESEVNGESFRKLKGISKFTRRELGAVATLYEWRDSVARSVDRPPFKVLTNESLLNIAQALPTSLEELEKVRGMPAVVVRKHGAEIAERLARVAAAAEDELPERESSKPWARDVELERRVERLKKVRDVVAADLGLDGSVIAPRHVLGSIAAMQPKSVEELQEVTALRDWQRRLLGEKFLAVLT